MKLSVAALQAHNVMRRKTNGQHARLHAPQVLTQWMLMMTIGVARHLDHALQVLRLRLTTICRKRHGWTKNVLVRVTTAKNQCAVRRLGHSVFARSRAGQHANHIVLQEVQIPLMQTMILGTARGLAAELQAYTKIMEFQLLG